jgi:hypothetical protein
LDWCWYLRRQGKAGEAFERILHNIGVMHPGGWADWKPSTLTDTGAPVAMTFTKDDNALELTTEVGDPSGDPTNRVNDVCKIMAELGANVPSAALRDVISAAQSDANLRYGARLGLRHDGKQCEPTLYAELPAAAADLSGLMSPAPFTAALNALGDKVRTTMLAFHGKTGQVTIYWVIDGADRATLAQLAAPAEVSSDALALAIDEMTGTGTPTSLPTQKLGFSYTTGKDGPPELALYFSAKHMFGLDPMIEKHVRACGGDTMRAYTNLMDIQYAAPAGQTNHGLVGMAARKNAEPVLSISVAAPWHCPFETM